MATHQMLCGLILDPKLTYIHNISVQAHKIGVNRRRNSWLLIRQSWVRIWSMPLLYGRLLHPRPVLINCKSYRMQHWDLPQDAHKRQIYNTFLCEVEAPDNNRPLTKVSEDPNHAAVLTPSHFLLLRGTPNYTLGKLYPMETSPVFSRRFLETIDSGIHVSTAC